MVRPLTLVVSLLLALSALAPAEATAAPGDMDPAFSEDGFARASFGELAQESLHLAEAHATQAAPAGNGSLVALGTAYYNDSDCVSAQFCTPIPFGPAIAAFGSDGALNTGFSGNGQLETGDSGTWAGAIALREDGRILLAGVREGLWVAGVNPDGSADSSFGGGGQVSYALGNGRERAAAIELMTDGRIVIAGSSDTQTSTGDLLTVRLLEDGSLDPTYSGNGWRVDDLGDTHLYGLVQVEVLPGGAILGLTELLGPPRRIAVVRYQADGAADASFGRNGVATVSLDQLEFAEEMEVDSQGRVLVTGRVDPAGTEDEATSQVVRLTPQGAVDRSFGDGGAVVVERFPDGRTPFHGPAIAVGARDEIYVASADRGVRLLRLTEDGQRDPSFAAGGTRTIYLRGGAIGVRDLAVTGDHGFVVGDATSEDAPRPAALAARFELADDGRSDADADGIENGSDECPFVYGGCPRGGTSVGLELKGKGKSRRLLGEVRSRSTGCASERTVELIHRRHGRKRTLATLDVPLAWFLTDQVPRRGRIRAVVPEAAHDFGICLPGKSRSIRLRKRAR